MTLNLRNLETLYQLVPSAAFVPHGAGKTRKSQAVCTPLNAHTASLLQACVGLQLTVLTRDNGCGATMVTGIGAHGF